MRLALLPFMLALLGLVPACGPGQQCAIDTDCELGFYCSLAGSCLERGTSSGTDSGPRTDGGMVSDTGPRDAAVGDAPRVDAPATTDAPDDAPSTCPAVGGTYTLTSVGIGCSALTAASMTLSGPAPTECAFEVALDATSVGAVALTGRSSFDGVLTIGSTPTDCSLAFDATLENVDVTCGACLFSASTTRL